MEELDIIKLIIDEDPDEIEKLEFIDEFIFD
jgi:hypothetical protein